MIPEEHVRDALTGLVDGRIFPDFAPSNTPVPFITFQAVGGEPINFVSGDLPDKTNTRMQVNVWAEDRFEAAALGQQVEEAMRAVVSLQVEVITGRVSTFDENTNFRGTMQDFSLWT
jgi:hypothetical protein